MSIIQIENLKKAYDTNYVLKGINLDIEAGQIVGYIGPNGAGKSTNYKLRFTNLKHYLKVVNPN